MQTRYEEYNAALGEPPFVLIDDIKRTKSIASQSQNWHENLEIQFCKSGEGFVRIDGKNHAFREGDVALVDSGSIHYTYSDTELVYSCIIVSTDFCKQMGIDCLSLSFSPVLRNENIAALFLEICDGYKDDGALRTAKLSSLLLKILIDAVSNYSEPKSVVRGEERELFTVKKVLIYIRENFQRKITLDAVSRHTLTDKYTLCKIFKKVTGQTIFENLNAYRCIKAAEYIAEGRSVCEAAVISGFENNSFFTKTFKRYMGVLPSKISARKQKS